MSQGPEIPEVARALEAMIEQGAELTLMSGPRGLLAHAKLLPNGSLHYVFAFDDTPNWDHVLAPMNLVDDGYYIRIGGPENQLLGVISPLETEEEIERWKQWAAFINTPPGAAWMLSVERAYQGHLNWSSGVNAQILAGGHHPSRNSA
jgi:hypothetical protein